MRTQQLAREEVPWIRNRRRHLERLRTAPEAAAPAVFHERLLTGLRRHLKDRFRTGEPAGQPVEPSFHTSAIP